MPQLRTVFLSGLHQIAKFFSLLDQWEEPLAFILTDFTLHPASLQGTLGSGMVLGSRKPSLTGLNKSLSTEGAKRPHPLSTTAQGIQVTHPGIPEVVICGAFCHQVVDDHRVRLSNAVHAVLGLDQHLCGQGTRQLMKGLSKSIPSQGGASIH